MGDELTRDQIPEPSMEPTGLMWVLWAYPIFSILLMLINLYFIVHALRTGRPYYWIWIIIAMPVLGAAAYFLVEMKPKARRIDWASIRWRLASPATRIAMLQDSVAHAPTVKTRSRLAREYELQEKWWLAVEEYRQCLTGVFVDDPRLQILLACALLESGEKDQAYQIVSAIAVQRDTKLDEERRLALHRCQAAIGKCEEAIEGLTQIAARSYSLGPRYYLAQAKRLAGRNGEANQDLQSLIQTFRRGNALLRKSEQEWYGKAVHLLRKS